MKKFGIISGIVVLLAAGIFALLVFLGVFKDRVKVEDLPQYTIVYSYETTQPVVEAAQEFAAKINEKYGVQIEVRSDLEKPVGEFEILIGKPQREESEKYVDGLRTAGYGYTIVEDKVLIAGRNTETTVMAIADFTENVLNRNSDDDLIFYSEDYNKTEKGKYVLSELSVGGISINKFRIVHPGAVKNGENLYADSLASQIAEIVGYSVEVISDDIITEDVKNEIYVGVTNHKEVDVQLSDNQYYIGYDGEKIQLCGNSEEAFYNAVNKLIELFTDTDKDKHNVKLEAEGIYDFDTSEMRAMSFNVYCANLIDERVNRVMDIIEKYMPDTVGVQEATPEWMKLFKDRLGSMYKSVGVGRDGGNKGEYSAILYNWHIFDVVDSGTKWLSDTPDEVSKVEESSLNRIFTYALLERKSDGKMVLVVNTHLEHSSGDARKKQVDVLLKFLAENDEYPVILTGDFNAKVDSAVYKKVINGGFSDSVSLASDKYEAATFTNYGASESIIDFVFVTETDFDIEQYRVCNEKVDSNFPSDHHPVYVKYKFKQN